MKEDAQASFFACGVSICAWHIAVSGERKYNEDKKKGSALAVGFRVSLCVNASEWRKGMGIKMKKIKKGVMMLFFGVMIMTVFACAKGEQRTGGDTPRETAEYMMERLKELDLAVFNACTDNYVGTYRNWIGIATEREYRVFNELQQPGIVKGRRYESNHKFAEKIMEHMEWEITDVRQEGKKAEIDMIITNMNMQDVIGDYEIRILENMLESTGSGVGQLIRNMSDLANGKEELLSIIEELDEDEFCTMEVTVLAYREDNQWKIHVSEEFVNAFMGNMMAAEYSEDMEQRIEKLMEEYERKIDEWADEVEESVEEWADRVFD